MLGENEQTTSGWGRPATCSSGIPLFRLFELCLSTLADKYGHLSISMCGFGLTEVMHTSSLML